MNNKAKALLRRYKERREKLRIAGCPWVNHPQKTPTGAYNIPSLDESLYWDYVAGVIDLRKAAEEFCKGNWDPFVNEERTMERFREIDKKYHKLEK